MVAPDKFRGSLTAAQASESIARGLLRALPDLEVRRLPIADGGDGTLDVLEAAGFGPRQVAATGPTGLPVAARIALRGATAVVELAEAAGMRRLPGGRADAAGASSFGVGQLVAAALDAGCKTLVLGLGGSACTDGGAGMLAALGARLLDREGRPVPSGGAGLASVRTVDLSRLDGRLAGVEVVAACDVDNPLLGVDGAAASYGPQKGASEQEVALLEEGLTAWAGVVAEATGRDVSALAGTGAAGGAGFAASALLGARIERGADVVLSLLGFDSALDGARLVVTGEGCLDDQTLRGKAPARAAALAARRAVPAVAVVGTSSLASGVATAVGLARVFCLTDLEARREVCMSDAARLLEELSASCVAQLCLAR